MASLHTSAPPSHSIGTLRRPSIGIYAPFPICVAPARRDSNGNINSRLKKELQVQVNKRWSRVCASNMNPPEKSLGTKSSDDGSNPPLLTILAGLVVFLFISWILVSVVMWIIGLISHLPQWK